MAVNKSMHPRNRYKDRPPDFAFLASKYPDFRQHVNTNLIGGVSLNFKDPKAVRELTCTLLKEDFGLTIDIPLERLIPTVPLRLNYIHWVEDLIGHHASSEKKITRGIDIGTGASCIYPLLGATMNGWFFLATEVDDMCFNYANKNVEQNNLSDLIKVVKVPQKTLLMDALKEESEIIYDFCMCNPPFFANQLEAKGINSRNAHRPPPSSVNTGGITEIMAEGGELEFVKRIIHDSLQLKQRLRWYSCMLGKKCSLAPLKEELRKQGVPKVAHTEFCQGRTMRWALAWSFYDDVTVPSPPCKKRKLEKTRKPLTFTVLEPIVKDLSQKLCSTGHPVSEGIYVVATWIENILTALQVHHKRVPSGKEEISIFLTAVVNSWLHTRRKKRERVRQLRELPRATEDALQSVDKDKTLSGEQSSTLSSEKVTQELEVKEPVAESTAITLVQSSSNDKEGMEQSNTETMECESAQTGDEVPESDDPSLIDSGEKQCQTANVCDISVLEEKTKKDKDFLFKCLLNVRREDNNFLVEMHWVEGDNRDLMNQLCTYLRNQIFRMEIS
ncbi:RNA N6-adenosine-methyltransferase METTL16 [Protopterus annectens]|uniref:RNA N6-adenosine-methyltransferase METTL16 n=1 Tax=Protopterus annectens TaxID=7888 RepID=UPI001CF959F9|nr:RNA N6-adenosine-methyltransferase METTL16 [Protopterus annectens]XP_043945845.1 RNA N6-adenosine-methyltransferase METTL16 [Protopterus annectens]